MVCTLARRGKSVVTRRASPDDLAMINGVHRCKYVRCVAVLADAGCHNVLRILADANDAVVAAHAVAGNTSMVKRRRSPPDSRVTVVAGVTAGQMIRVLACRRDTVMAGAAAADHVGVIDCEYR